jgi:hypothetical protein
VLDGLGTYLRPDRELARPGVRPGRTATNKVNHDQGD